MAVDERLDVGRGVVGHRILEGVPHHHQRPASRHEVLVREVLRRLDVFREGQDHDVEPRSIILGVEEGAVRHVHVGQDLDVLSDLQPAVHRGLRREKLVLPVAQPPALVVAVAARHVGAQEVRLVVTLAVTKL